MKRLFELRDYHFELQKDIAKILNVTRRNYTDIENGFVMPTYDKLSKIAYHYEVSTDYILELTNVQAPHIITGKCDVSRLKILRKSKRLSQEKIGELLGVAQDTYGKYEQNRIKIPLSKLIKLSDFYNVSVDYLLNRTDDPTRY